MKFEILSDQVLVVRDAFSELECKALIERAESAGFEDAPVTTADGPVMMKRIRDNHRAMIDDVGLAGTFWGRIGAFAPGRLFGRSAIGLNERFRFYRYGPGQTFRWHSDGYYERANGERSQYTLMLYLNEGFDGGATEFHDCRVRPERGMAVLFYHHQRHRGAPVVAGVKYVIRTDVMYSPLSA